MFIKKYNKISHIVHILNLSLYNAGCEFVHDIINDVVNNLDNGDLNSSSILTCDILKYGILTNKIIVKHSKGKVYNKSNYNELLTIIKSNFADFLDLKNGEFRYHYGIYYTDNWKIELSKIGLWKE